MENLKELQEMAKSGEFSEKLLKNEEFKRDLKKILKEENGIEITDEQIPEIIKKIEDALQDKKVLEEAKLDDISGGSPYNPRYNSNYNSQNSRPLTKSEKVKFVGAAVGAVFGAIGSAGLVAGAYDDPGKQLKKENKRYARAKLRNDVVDLVYTGFGSERPYHVPETFEAGPIHTAGTLGGAAGAGVGYGIGSLICKALDIN